ncbi:type II toxin-antitoxin system RelE/ParE family toxin [Rhodopirellula sp. P2]|uniref:type II toxin-antitoxin system RelE/ParE family toxin n=1 Tax=Rhodopirellula sp. P2 TaxID=2127060 RepID=UPI002367B370|nr:type II toxin-antitoxin system RelE/ParE family toxin [Rhodopirellula sp. P2]WDQ15028.1 type II toxin-antitoxin system RelE/ParE family toxin [Rhodopirellula sp. P2]
MANVIICWAAEVDFIESLKLYAERSIETANDFDAEFDRAISQSAADPERFLMCDARHRYLLLRRFPFRIIYRIANSDILAIAVAHGSRSPDYWTNR